MEELKFKLDIFEGPLDLLCHLIEKNKMYKMYKNVKNGKKMWFFEKLTYPSFPH